MDWATVKDDTYYRGRALESEARTASSPEKWLEYAELKTSKGSYTLAVHGYMNAANLYEACGNTDAAVAAYTQGLAAAMRAAHVDLAVILAYRIAQIHENAAQWDECIAVYERVGQFCSDRDAHFQAADAYEHAAEMMTRAGRDTSRYDLPIRHWQGNIHHWHKHHHDHDAVWSQKHIELYRKLFKVET